MTPFVGLRYIIAMQGNVPSPSSWVDPPYLGEIKIWPAASMVPKDWAECSGQLYATASYPALFNLLGTTYGGDGANTFGLPDLRGRVPLGSGQGAGLSNGSEGEIGGAESVGLNETELRAHTHTIPAPAP